MRCARMVPPGTMLLALLLIANVAAQQEGAGQMSLEELREMRRELAFAPRGIIANNDGCDVLYFPRDDEITVQSFLDRRTTVLADEDSQVSTIAYCTISSGFSFFTHDTKVGTVLARESGDYGINPQMRNATQPLIDLGSDCLQSVVDFGHANGIEVFWSMRMNDTHDNAHSPDKPYLLFPPLKEQHPEWLVGAHDARTPHGRWSSVDYAREEIRDLAFAYIDEVCRNYDVDGIELDFFRHLCFFASTANGGVASEAEREMMTDLMRRVRGMTEEVGQQRGRPILVAIRVPDSVEFSRDMGLDLERWLQEGLADILITTCYFRLNPWDYTVELAHANGVAAYPCLSDSRVRGESRFHRKSLECYRGRAMNAWAAGADGIHTFNLFSPTSQIFREIGDPASLVAKDKLYFATIIDGGPNSWLAGGAKYQTIPIITPSHPATLRRGEALEVDLRVGEDFAAAREAGAEPTVTLHLELPGITDVEQIDVSLNGQRLSGGTVSEGWLDLPVDATILQRGSNSVKIALADRQAEDGDRWNLAWEGTQKPVAPWYRDPGSVRTEEALQDGAMLIADRGQEAGDYHYYRYAWGVDASEPAVVEAQAKVISGSSCVIVSNGTAQERLTLWPDHIDLHFNRDIRYDMDTTDDFHTYRLEMQGEDLKVYVDGELRLDATGLYNKGGAGSSILSFGAANSPMLGEALWRQVRARFTGQSCRDVVLSVRYE
ncbi:MAG: hypothetical protein GX131_06635 [candidate division WS1 bacterium]|nr:hypothetical protein [candidate division WS1 bacterium]